MSDFTDLQPCPGDKVAACAHATRDDCTVEFFKVAGVTLTRPDNSAWLAVCEGCMGARSDPFASISQDFVWMLERVLVDFLEEDVICKPGALYVGQWKQ